MASKKTEKTDALEPGSIVSLPGQPSSHFAIVYASEYAAGVLKSIRYVPLIRISMKDMPAALGHDELHIDSRIIGRLKRENGSAAFTLSAKVADDWKTFILRYELKKYEVTPEVAADNMFFQYGHTAGTKFWADLCQRVVESYLAEHDIYLTEPAPKKKARTSARRKDGSPPGLATISNPMVSVTDISLKDAAELGYISPNTQRVFETIPIGSGEPLRLGEAFALVERNAKKKIAALGSAFDAAATRDPKFNLGEVVRDVTDGWNSFEEQMDDPEEYGDMPESVRTSWPSRQIV